MAYNYPTAEGIKFAMEEGWTREQAERGFEIFDFEGTGLLEVEAIFDCYPDGNGDDDEAAKEAERTGYCKIIPIDELPNPFIIYGSDRRFFGWVDTPENRKHIEEFAKQEKEMIKFTSKISGTQVTGSEIDEVLNNLVFDSQLITLNSIQEKIHRQESMNWILDTLRFTKSADGKNWFATISWDSIAGLTVMEKYPEVEKQFIEYFGKNWMEHYIRFNH